VAVVQGDRVLAEARAAEGETGAASLLPCVDEALRRAELALDAIEAFAVSVGPGSFTGLRVGVATLKGLAFGTGRPVAPVSTLAALACRIPAGREPAVALLDAQRGEVYAALFHRDGDEPRAGEPGEGVYAPDALARALPACCVLVGEMVARCGERIRELRGPGVTLGPPEPPRAADVAFLGRRLLARGAGIDAALLVPRYVRRAEAEVRRSGQRFE
jgi:tRNA threonylcarbamoyladenosine biosynthesis protein TsaB